MSEMTELQYHVWSIIAQHRGKAHAISKRRLVALVGKHERAVRLAIKALREEHGYLIASTLGARSNVRGVRAGGEPTFEEPTREEPSGYFVPVAQDEVDEYAARLKSIIASHARALRAIEQSAADAVLMAVNPDQINLFSREVRDGDAT